ncbi:hypothetical protein V8E51_015625 [Hyaloscypha variabilis]
MNSFKLGLFPSVTAICGRCGSSPKRCMCYNRMEDLSPESWGGWNIDYPSDRELSSRKRRANESEIPVILPLTSEVITSLGDLLFHLSGCGITSRRRKHGGEHSHRPIQDFSEFVTGTTNNILEPVKQGLGKQDETISAILSMAEASVRHGNLQTVREVEEYITVTARYLASGYKSFTTLVSKILEHCLAASDQMTWDRVYPASTTDQEEYSLSYIKRKEATEIVWAMQNFNNQDKTADTVNFGTLTVTQMVNSTPQLCENESSSKGDSPPSKKAKRSPLSPNSISTGQSSSTPISSSGSDIPPSSKLHCQYGNCKNVYTGNDARVNLRRHIRTVHEVSKAIKCPACGHEASRRDNVRKHFLLKHKGEVLPAVLMCKTRS